MYRMTGWIRITSLVALIAAAACTPRAAERQPEQRAATEPIAVEMEPGDLARVQGISVGRADAPVVIYEFADFQCPACAQFAAVVTPHIKQRHVEAGTVRYVHYDFPLIRIHPHAFLAARAGRCANEQGRFWEYHDLLYAEQQSWSRREEVLPLFVEYAQPTGLDRNSFESCLRSDRYAVEVTQNMRLGESLNVPGTPTLYINGRRAEIRTLEDLDQLIAQEAGTVSGPP
jgi:protein-disulfide isomerase